MAAYLQEYPEAQSDFRLSSGGLVYTAHDIALILPEEVPFEDEENEGVRALFRLLAEPAGIKLLALWYKQPSVGKPFTFTVASLSKKTGLSPEEIDAVLPSFEAFRLFDTEDVETDEGSLKIILQADSLKFVFLLPVLLLIARRIADDSDHWIGMRGYRYAVCVIDSRC